MQIFIPAQVKDAPARVASLHAEVSDVIFDSSGIRLIFRIKHIGRESQQLMDSYGNS